jgi:hypothetical protein
LSSGQRVSINTWAGDESWLIRVRSQLGRDGTQDRRRRGDRRSGEVQSGGVHDDGRASALRGLGVDEARWLARL